MHGLLPGTKGKNEMGDQVLPKFISSVIFGIYGLMGVREIVMEDVWKRSLAIIRKVDGMEGK